MDTKLNLNHPMPILQQIKHSFQWQRAINNFRPITKILQQRGDRGITA